MKILKRKTQAYFQKADLTENTEYLMNPGRGWYQIHTFPLQENVDVKELSYCVNKDETLALLLFDIGAYRNVLLSDASLGRMQEVLEFFAKQDKELIVRVVYDREGKGMEHEPDTIGMVEAHMKQVGVLLRQYEPYILVVQGLLVGNWGELHGSKFLSKDKLNELMQTYRNALGQTMKLAVRKPMQWRQLHMEHMENKDSHIGLFDDGMFGSIDHLGTYGRQSREDAGWEKEWSPDEETEFVAELAERIPYGGEAVGTDMCGEFGNALVQLSQSHVSYLNSRYDTQILSRWKEANWTGEGVWNGCNGYDYIGCHLGYRLVVRSVKYETHGWVRPMAEVMITIANTGFAPLYEEIGLAAVWETEGEEINLQHIQDITLWREGEEKLFKLSPPTTDSKKQFRLYLQVQRNRDKKPIYLANAGGKERLFLGLFGNR